MSQSLLDAAAAAERAGFPERAAALRKIAGAEPTPAAVAPAPARAPAPQEFSPPPGARMADDSGLVGMNQDQIREARAQQRAEREQTPAEPPLEYIRSAAPVGQLMERLAEDYRPPPTPLQQTIATLGRDREFAYMQRAAPRTPRTMMVETDRFPSQQRRRNINLDLQAAETQQAIEDFRRERELYYRQQQRLVPREPQVSEEGIVGRALRSINPLSTRPTLPAATPESLAARDVEELYVTEYGVAPDQARYVRERAEDARRRANIDVRSIEGMRLDPDGRKRTGMEGGVLTGMIPWVNLPVARETRIREVRETDPMTGRTVIKEKYRDPVTGALSDPTAWQTLVESSARQVYTPDLVENIRKQRAAENQRRLLESTPGMLANPEYQRQLALENEPLMSGLMTTINTEAGLLQETPATQILRLTGIFPAAVNTAVFDFMPFFYEMDPETGRPLDPDDLAYKMDQLLRSGMKFVGYDQEEIEKLRTGGFQIGGYDPESDSPLPYIPGQTQEQTRRQAEEAGTFLPLPFQGVARSRPTAVDPTGQRVARQSGNIIEKFATALARGRSLGDEFMSIPAFVAEFDDAEPYELQPGYGVLQDRYQEIPGNVPTAPFWMGIGIEALYGVGPLAAARAGGRLALKGAQRAGAAAKTRGTGRVARAGEVVEKAAYTAANPREAANQSQVIRYAQELQESDEGLSNIDIVKGLNNTSRVVSEAVAEEVVAPYLLQARLRADPTQPVTVGELADLAANSRAARKVLDDAGILNANRTDKVTPAQAATIETSTNRYIASSRRNSVAATMASDLPTQAKARAIRDELQDAGVNLNRVPGGRVILSQATGGAADPAALSAAADQLVQLDGAVAIRGTKPVVSTLHDLGRQAVQRASSADATPFDGPVGTVVNRRLGNDRVNAAFMRDRPQEVLRATAGAGARAVESTLENLVDRNMTAVTKNLMVPTERLTDEVFESVAGIMEPLRPTTRLGPVINGNRAEVYEYPIAAVQPFIRAAGRGNIERSEFLSGVLVRMQNKQPLTGAEYAVVNDILEGSAYRQVLGTQARDTLFYGSQVERADVPLVERGFSLRPETRVQRTGNARRLAKDIVTIVKVSGGSALGRALRDVAKRAGAQVEEIPTRFPQQTHQAIGRMNKTIKNRLGTVGDNVRVEIRDLRVQTGDPEAAFNIVIERRIERAIEDAVQGVDASAERLMRQYNMDPEQAYFYIAYQSPSATSIRGLGQMAQNAIPANIRTLATDREKAAVMYDAWKSLLQDFFGQDAYREIFGNGDAVLRTYIAAPGKNPNLLEAVGDIRPFTTEQVREVVRNLGQNIAQAEGRGLSMTPFASAVGVPTRDGVFPALLSWVMGSDSRAIVRQVQREAAAVNPGLYVDVMPSTYGRSPGRVDQEANLLLSNRKGTLDALTEVYENTPPGQRPRMSTLENNTGTTSFSAPSTVASATRPAVNRAGQRVPEEVGQYTGELDRIAQKHGLSMTPRNRLELAHAVYEHLVTQRRTTPNYEMLLGNLAENANLNLSTFQTNAVTSDIKAVIRGLDETFARFAANNGLSPDAVFLFNRTIPQDLEDLLTANVFGNRADATLYMHLLQAKAGGATDDVIITALRRNLVDRAFDTYVRPLADDIAAQRRALGFEPSTDKEAMSNALRDLEMIDPNDPRLAMYGSDFSSAVEELQAAARTGKLASNIDALRNRDAMTRALDSNPPTKERRSAAMAAALGLLQSAVIAGRRSAAGGMLAGPNFSLGNARYAGMNAMTAPLLAAVTSGPVNAVRMLSGPGYASQTRDVARQFNSIVGRPLFNVRGPRNPDDLAFTTRTGRPVTQRELESMVQRNNLGSSRGQVEFNDAFIGEVMREGGVLQDATPAGPFRQFLSQLDPTKTSQFQYMANATDKAFRENIFASALRQGMTEEQAASLARAVVLDYGAVPDRIKNSVNRYVLFATFKTVNYTETLRGLARDPNTFMRALNLLDNSQQQENVAAFGQDYVRTRPMLSDVYDFEGVGTGVFGPSIPAADALVDFANLAAYSANLGPEENENARRALLAASEENLVPLISPIFGAVGDARSPNDPGRKITSNELAFMLRFPQTLWPEMQEKFNLMPVEGEAGTPGRQRVIDPAMPQMGPREYRFDKVSDERRYNWLMTLLTYMSINRQRQFLSKMGSAGVASPYIDPTREGLVHPFFFYPGAATAIQLTDVEKQAERALKEQQKAALGRSRRQKQDVGRPRK